MSETYKFIVTVDIWANDLAQAYLTLRNRMDEISDFYGEWESTDQVYEDEDPVDPGRLERERLRVLGMGRSKSAPKQSAPGSDYRFVIEVDITGLGLADAYTTLRSGLTAAFGGDWESTDEVYDEYGEPIDPGEFELARLAAGLPFAAMHGVTMKCDRVMKRPDGLMGGTSMDHWKCVFRRKGSRSSMTVYYSMGSGHRGRAPNADEVLLSIASDSNSYDVEDGFESWAESYGYDPYEDNREARKVWSQVGKQREAAFKFLGEELYHQLLNVEQ